MPVYVEKFLLPILAGSIVTLLVLNPFKLDWQQRLSLFVAVNALGFFLAHTLYKGKQIDVNPERAWLAVDMRADFTKVVDRINQGNIIVSVTNTGRSAATNVRLSYCVGNSASVEVPDCAMQTVTFPDLAPSVTRGWMQPITYPFPDAPSYQDYRPLFIKGRFEYSHGYGDGSTTFCAFLDETVPSSLLRMCSRHNETR